MSNFVVKRSNPRKYKRYSSYRNILREDCKYHCVYCLMHEYHFGGAKHGEIDHFHPVSKGGDKSSYVNLFWSCRRCNKYKLDNWPNAILQQKGFRFIDPSNDDYMDHFSFGHDGSIQHKTPPGEYTIDIIRLDTEVLRDIRKKMMDNYDLYQEILSVVGTLGSSELEREKIAKEIIKNLKCSEDEKIRRLRELDNCATFLFPSVFITEYSKPQTEFRNLPPYMGHDK